ncbi:MAG: type II secretion system F family protein [Acetobacteraceae bacterium]
MNDQVVLLLVGGAALLCIVSAGLLLQTTTRQGRFRARIRLVQANTGLVAAEPPVAVGGRGILRLVAMIGMIFARSGLFSTRTLTEFEQTLLSCGFRGPNGLGLFVGGKLLLVCLLPLIAWPLAGSLHLPGILHTVLVLGAAVLGLLSPDIIARKLRTRYLKRLEKGVPDALDMLVICAEAGLSLEPAISKVGIEIGFANRAVSEELARTASELRITSDTRTALINLGKRTGLESLKRLGAVLTQSIQYGTPLTRALRVLSAEMREEMLTRFEARAARLPVLLTVPMIVFILPCVFMIVGGPAMLNILHAFHHH